jgi:hypothetical protein
MTLTITVRDSCGTHLARAKGLNITASCTSGPEQAMRACVAKIAPGRPFVFEGNESGVYQIEIREEA